MPRKRYTRREFLKLGAFALTTGTVGPGVGYAYSTLLEPHWIDLTQISLTLPRLSPAFDGYRIAQFNDLHLGGWMTQERLARVVDLINLQEPDIIAIVGDIVSLINLSVQKAINAEVSRLEAPDGVFAVLGNHDHWTNAQEVTKMLKGSGAKVLKNDIYPISRQGHHLHICGIDDFWEKQHDLDLVLDKLPTAGCAILLAHEPDFADISGPTGRFDLQISGHSHGGQVVIPFLKPPALPLHGQKYHTGLYQVDGMYQYTNRGVGMISPRVRFNCRPEITIFTLQSP